MNFTIPQAQVQARASCQFDESTIDKRLAILCSGEPTEETRREIEFLENLKVELASAHEENER